MLTVPPHQALACFSRKTASWFAQTYGEPTEVQALSWPKIAAGENILATAPTGCGKTLAAFLWAIDSLATGRWQPGSVRVLYISPLKALNNDVRRNLLLPIEQLGADISVGTRSGDTPQAERQRQKKHPPDILITTPESLNVLLTSRGGRALFSDLKLVIVDEVHAVADSKRGTHLMTAIERLVPLSGEFQRVALSATVHPISRIARWFAGHCVVQDTPLVLEPRSIAVVQAPGHKKYELEVTGVPVSVPAPTAARLAGEAKRPGNADQDGDGVYRALARLALGRIEKNRSTLIFGSGRRSVEKVTRFINTTAEHEVDVAYAHHGSLSKEVRSVVEERLKAGKLKAIVATSSLELGIDIGALDEVIQVQTPHSVASMVQRMGRAGHAVGETSRALLVPLFERDVLGAMVVAKAALAGEYESLQPLVGGLDVLAQVILSMTATEVWQVDAIYAVVRSCDAYAALSREQFDNVLEMLSGRYDSAQVRSLEARLLWDKADGSVRAKRGVERLVYGSGGTIADRGYYQLRLADTKAKLGELDEEFVWERSVGDSFTLGTRAWRIEQITHNDVFVRPADKGGALIPFWRAEERDRGFFLSEKLSGFLAEAEELLASGQRRQLEQLVQSEYPLQKKAVADVVELLVKQRAATGGSLPHRKHLLVEYYRDPHNNQERRQVILHTFWGGQVNRPFAMAIASAWAQAHGVPLEVMHTDDCVVLALSDDFSLSDVLRLVRAENLTSLLRAQLANSGLFGARFRENAGCALLLPRGDFRRRLPLWLNRMRSKKLMAAVSKQQNFPITLETWRGCLQESFDLKNLAMLLDELQERQIEITEVYTDAPSPFCKEVVWKHINEEMYKDDKPAHGKHTSPTADWLREVTLSSSLRPRIKQALSQELQQKLQRTYPGYAPRDTAELFNWLKERVAIPEQEWQALLQAKLRDYDDAARSRLVEDELISKTQWVALGAERLILANETLERLPAIGRLIADVSRRSDAAESTDAAELAQVFREWLRFYGPTPLASVAETWGLPVAVLSRLLDTLVEADELVVDTLHSDAVELEICDSQNLETLLRWTRSRQRKTVEALSFSHLGLFWAVHQGVVTERVGSAARLGESLTQLALLAAPAGAWEKEILPARLRPYHTAWLDALFAEDELLWRGMGNEKLAFLLPEELQLLSAAEQPSTSNAPPLPELLQSPSSGRHRLPDMASAAGLSTAELHTDLWAAAWLGRVSNDGFAAIRQGVLRRFVEPPASPPSGASRGRRRLSRPRLRPHSGAWFALPEFEKGEAALDSLDKIERNKERARVLLERYGVVFREVVTREAQGFLWRDVFSALRLMELSGEVSCGHFFEQIQGLQFASAEAAARLRKGLPSDSVYWVSALDPACATGLGLADVELALPHRRAGVHIVFRGIEPVIVSTSGGKELKISLSLETPDIERYFEFLRVALTRGFAPRNGIEIESINAESAAMSPWRQVLAATFDVVAGPRKITLQRSYGA